MALVSLSLDNFESLILNEYNEDGYLPLGLEDAKEHPAFDDLHKLLKSSKSDFNTDNCLTLKVEHGSAAAVYGFNLLQKANKATLQFGSSNGDKPNNEVEVTVEKTPGEDGEEIIKFKAGNATVYFNRGGSNKPDAKPYFFLKFGKAEAQIYVNLASDSITAKHFDEVETTEDLVNLLKAPPTRGVKLVDITRPYAKQGVKGVLKNPIMAEVLNWEIQEPHPQYGSSMLLKIRGVDIAQYDDKKGDTIVKNPSAVYLNANQASNKMLMLPSFAKQVLLYKHFDGKLFLKITALNAKDPEVNAPNNTLVLQKPSDPQKLAALETALALSKKGLEFGDIMKQVSVPSQLSIAPSVAPSVTVQTPVAAKELVTVAATVVSSSDELDDF